MTPPPPGHARASTLASPPGSNSGEQATLVELLTQQRDHYRQLKTLSDEQQQLVAAGQPEQLLAVLGQRQRHVEALTTLNEQLAPLRPRMSEVAEASPASVRDQLRGLVDEVQDLLEAIIHQDEQDKQRLTQGRDAIKTQLAKVARTPAALSAYKTASPAKGTPRFTDRRG